MTDAARDPGQRDGKARILQAVIDLLARQGISGVSMRAVAREAGVSLGLLSYHYEDKTDLIRAALHRIEESDLAILEPDPALAPMKRLRRALRRIADPEFLNTEYLSLRLQLWALPRTHEDFERINAMAQQRYRDVLADLIRAARPDLARAECGRRAADIDVIQNGIWLTALLGLDAAAIKRAVARSEEIALA